MSANFLKVILINTRIKLVLWANTCTSCMRLTPTVPTMECDTDPKQVTAAEKSNINGDSFTSNATKKRRLREASDSPIRVDISSLTRNVNDQNYFSILGELEFENVDPSPTTTITEKSTGVPAAAAKTTTTTPTSKSFCPPIIIYDTNVKNLIQQLEDKSPKITYKVKNVGKNKCKLYFSDPFVHAEMMTLLREKEVPSYSFTPKEFKQVSLILRGLCNGTEAEEVKNTLEAVVPNTVYKVNKFTTKYSLKNNSDTGLFLVSLIPGKRDTDILNIKYLQSQVVRWEKPKKKEEEIQCRRCQKWGHVARNCNAMFKCVKCEKKHAPGECLRKQNEDSSPFCVNCGETGHPANWKGCPIYKNHILIQRERLTKAREERNAVKSNVNRAINSALVTPGKSFAKLFQTKSNQKTDTKSSIVEEFLQLANHFLATEELSLEEEISMFLSDYRKMSQLDAKAEFLRLFHKVKSTYGS